MRIERLALRNFGRFSRLELDLPAGFGVVVGRNEAGKTTFLEAVRSLLFGIHAQTPYAYRFGEMGYQGLEIEAVLSDRSGARWEIVRRKGARDTLGGTRIEARDGDGPGRRSPVDAAAFERALGGISRELYSSVFGFTLSDLQSGARLLETAEFDEILAGGALGGGGERVRALLEELETSCEELFSPRASKPRINELVRRAEEARKLAAAAALSESDHAGLESALQAARTQVASLGERWTALHRALARIQRLRSSLEPWRSRQAIAATFATLDARRLPFDAARARALRETGAAAAALARTAGEQRVRVDAIEKRIAEIVVDEPVLAQAARIIDCARRSEPVAERRAAAPEKERNLRRERDEVALEAAALGAAGGPEWLARWRPARDLRERLDALVARHEENAKSARDCESDLERDEQDRRELAEAAGAPAAEAGSDSLFDLERELPATEEGHVRLAGLRTRLKAIDDRCRARRDKLVPRLPAGADLAGLPLPRRETLAALAEERKSLLEQRGKLLGTLDERENRSEGARAQRDQLAASRGPVPKPEDLGSIRARRDVQWELVKKAWLAGAEVDADARRLDPGRRLPEAFESSLREADRTADRLREAADLVQVESDLGEKEKAVARARERVAAIDGQLSEWEARWREAWSPSGISPAAPDAMLSWLSEVEQLRQLADERLDDAAQLAELDAQVSSFSARLAAAFGASAAALPALAARLRERVEAIRAGRTRESERDASRAKLERRVRERQSRLERLRAEDAAIRAEFAKLLPEFGIETSVDPAQVRARIRDLDVLAGRARALLAGEDAFAADRALMASFEREVGGLAAEVGEATDGRAAEAVAGRLRERLDAARKAAQARDTLRESLLEERQGLEQRQQELAAIQAELSAACAASGAASVAELGVEIERLLEHAERRRQLDEAEARLAGQLGGGEARDEDEAALATASADELSAEEARLRSEIDACSNERLAAAQAQGAGERALEGRGSDEAARARAQYEELRAALEEQVQVYARSALARLALQRAVGAYVRDHQPRLLEHASRLLGAITAGRHPRIVRPLDGSAIVVLREDGVECTPERLSMGTREQLFLALRLAYVMEACERGEPLPLVLDDVLVNFDDERSMAALKALREVAESCQVLLLTCHEHVAALAKRAVPDAAVIAFGGAEGTPGSPEASATLASGR